MDFYSIQNFELCMKLFEKFLTESYGVTASSLEQVDIKKTLYKIISHTRDNYSSSKYDVKQMNNIVLNSLKDEVINKCKLVKQKKPSIRNLDREQMVYGNRPMYTTHMKPESNVNSSKDDVTRNFESLMSERSDIVSKPHTIPSFADEAYDENDNAIPQDDFAKKVSELQNARETYFMNTVDIHKNNDETKIEPKAFYEKIEEKNDKYNLEHALPFSNDVDRMINFKQMDIIKPTEKRFNFFKYISINSGDRSWDVHKHRFKYQIDTGLQKFRNITRVEFTKLIIPMEIIETQTLENNPKPFFNNEFSLSFPYVMLVVDELGDMYDGSNEKVRKCFAQFIYDSSFKAANGRGFIILKPMQEEMKYYLPTPLGMLPNLNISIQKPNGTLFNNSIDHFGVRSVQYEDFNRLYLKITVDKYFDKNEFYKGDTVQIKHFSLPSSTTAAHRFNEFINRSEGHEIVQVGTANSSGYCRSFYILGPGTLDQLQGIIVIDTEAIAQLQHHNSATNPTSVDVECCIDTCTDDSIGIIDPPPPVGNIERNGIIINQSLQNVLAMRLMTSQGDHTILNVQDI